jgi:uncharacterized protein YdhG (YjbR/CyaY superfamily)
LQPAIFAGGTLFGRRRHKVKPDLIAASFPKEHTTMVGKPTTIDEYLAAVPADKRAALESLRQIIREAAPQAEECISYQLPAFRHNGMLVGFGATTNHCALYLMSGSIVEVHQDELKDYDSSKGTIRFQADRPLPADLVRKLLQARMAENERRRKESP